MDGNAAGGPLAESRADCKGCGSVRTGRKNPRCEENIMQVTENRCGITVSDIQMSDGRVRLEVQMKPQVYYDILSELTGTAIHNEYELIHMIRELSAKKKEFDSVGNALSEVSASGFRGL